jgi:hypothetical protein
MPGVGNALKACVDASRLQALGIGFSELGTGGEILAAGECDDLGLNLAGARICAAIPPRQWCENTWARRLTASIANSTADEEKPMLVV